MESNVLIRQDDALKAIEALAVIPEPPEIIQCWECVFYTRNVFVYVNGIPLIAGHHMCSRWGDGCQTSPDGFCHMGMRKEKTCEKDEGAEDEGR